VTLNTYFSKGDLLFMHELIHLCISQHTTFELPGVTDSKNMAGVKNFLKNRLNWSWSRPFHRWFVIRMLELDIPTFIQTFTTLASAVPEIMTGAHQNLNGSRDSTTPLSGMVCHSWASTCYGQHSYQIWSLYLHSLRVRVNEDLKGNTKYRKWDGLGS